MGRQVKLQEIQDTQHRLALKHRNLDVILNSKLFELAWKKAELVDKKEVIELINNIKIDYIKKWIRTILFDIYGYTIRELRELASQHHISNYSRMSKEDLITILNKKGIKNVSKIQ